MPEESCIPNLAHHWIIMSPDGTRWVWGQCKFCGNFRLFSTSTPSTLTWRAARKRRENEQSRRLKKLERAGVPLRQIA